MAGPFGLSRNLLNPCVLGGGLAERAQGTFFIWASFYFCVFIFSGHFIFCFDFISNKKVVTSLLSWTNKLKGFVIVKRDRSSHQKRSQFPPKEAPKSLFLLLEAISAELADEVTIRHIITKPDLRLKTQSRIGIRSQIQTSSLATTPSSPLPSFPVPLTREPDPRTRHHVTFSKRHLPTDARAYRSW